MTDIDQLSRSIKDLEYRVKRLEQAQGQWAVNRTGYTSVYQTPVVQWCSCGREVCRAPDCPSHKPDPMGR